MSDDYGMWDYSCPNDCSNRFPAEPVPNVVKCYQCGAEMVVYADEENNE